MIGEDPCQFDVFTNFRFYTETKQKKTCVVPLFIPIEHTMSSSTNATAITPLQQTRQTNNRTGDEPKNRTNDTESDTESETETNNAIATELSPDVTLKTNFKSALISNTDHKLLFGKTITAISRNALMLLYRTVFAHVKDIWSACRDNKGLSGSVAKLHTFLGLKVPPVAYANMSSEKSPQIKPRVFFSTTPMHTDPEVVLELAEEIDNSGGVHPSGDPKVRLLCPETVAKHRLDQERIGKEKMPPPPSTAPGPTSDVAEKIRNLKEEIKSFEDEAAQTEKNIEEFDDNYLIRCRVKESSSTKDASAAASSKFSQKQTFDELCEATLVAKTTLEEEVADLKNNEKILNTTIENAVSWAEAADLVSPHADDVRNYRESVKNALFPDLPRVTNINWIPKGLPPTRNNKKRPRSAGSGA